MKKAFVTEKYTRNSVVKPQLIYFKWRHRDSRITRNVLTVFGPLFFFYTECTLCNVKENPMFGEEQWKAVAKIIIFWLKNANNLPFTCSILCFDHLNKTLDSLMQYILKTGAETLKATLKNVNPVNQSDLDDIITQHVLKRVPRQGKMKRILIELA